MVDWHIVTSSPGFTAAYPASSHCSTKGIGIGKFRLRAGGTSGGLDSIESSFPNMGIPNYFAYLISRDNAASVGKNTIPGLHFKWIFRQHISSLAHILGLGECFCNAKSFSIFERNYKFPFYLMSCKAPV